ncbi:heat shock 70 kDa protein 4 [Neocloeon triangulifer]|uniref:heat shock 70 kDa protein 4 n=1 Tax=Neocloeon triangulifer TaxID=2078957 RepID=UPI00286F5895|nr:heat shock 70 kDa protein 4 [Neocloeon triangulifer]
MSVIGIDFGNDSCYIAVARAGGIETIANDYSLRATPSCVAFSSKNRILGVAAQNQIVTNMKNSVYGFKRLMGRKANDPSLQFERKFLHYNFEGGANGDLVIRVHYKDKEQSFTPEQITAMLFTKLKDIAEKGLQTKVNDCVISVPSYYTCYERQAILNAAAIAGLNVLRLMNENLATALCYGIYKQDMPETDETARNVVFVDWGHSSFQVSITAFVKGKLRMLSCAGDGQLGGRDIDMILAEHFSDEFVSKYKINPRTNGRAMLRLLTAVEKLKKQMSANSTNLPLAIECFMNDIDVKSDMKRDDMELLCSHLFLKAEAVMQKCLDDSGLQIKDIHSVEIVGGSSRLPALKNLIQKVFCHQPSTTLNQDEAVARGCALQCALLSPAVRVRDFNITDIQLFPVHLAWDPEQGEGTSELEVFPHKHVVPFVKMLTFYRSNPFALRAFYKGAIPYPDPNIGVYKIHDVQPNAAGESQKIKVKVKMTLHGTFAISSAAMHETVIEPVSAPEPMEVDNQEAATPEEKQGAPPAGESQEEAGSQKEEKKEKKRTITTELPVQSITGSLKADSVDEFHKQEIQMINDDHEENERIDARNALEEFVYEMRSQLGSEECLAKYVKEDELSSLFVALENMETWLYEDGENCERKDYANRLSELKSKSDPIKQRKLEFECFPKIFEDFSRSIMLAEKTVSLAKSGHADYSHFTPDEIGSVEEAVKSAIAFMEEKRCLLAKASKTSDPPVTVSVLQAERKLFDSKVSVLKKPKPQPPAADPPKENETNNKDANTAENTNTDGGEAMQAE